MTLKVPIFIPLDPSDIIVVQWGPMNSNDTCQPIARGDLVDKTIQVEGGFGAGTSVTLQGSNDATTISNGNYHTLRDPFGNLIAITSANIQQVTEMTAWIKPVVTAGDGTETLTITVAIRRSYR